MLSGHALIRLEQKLSQVRMVERVTIHDVVLMSGYEFESFVAELFNKIWRHTQMTKSSGYQGVDIIAEREHTKSGYKRSVTEMQYRMQQYKKLLLEWNCMTYTKASL